MIFEANVVPGLCGKIARLVERGWNQEEFARQANLHRLTIRNILLGPNAACTTPPSAPAPRARPQRRRIANRALQRLLPKMRLPPDASKRRLYEEAMQPELKAWAERNPDRAAQLAPDEVDELLSLQGTGGPLTGFGVAHYVALLERRRKPSKR